MKKFNYALLLTISVLLIVSCSSPEKKAQKIGKQYCDCLDASLKGEMNSMQMEYMMDSCEKLIENDYNKALEKYQADEEKMKTFSLFYGTITDSSRIKANDFLEKALKKQLSSVLWVREGETDYKDYLYAFHGDTMEIVNRKGNYIFLLDGNKISFTGHKAEGMIRFTDLQKFELGSSDSAGGKSLYRAAKFSDSLVGTYGAKGWDYSYNYYWEDYNYERVSYSVTFKPGGELLDNRTRYKYEIRDKSMVWLNYSTGKDYKDFGEWKFSGRNTP